MITCHQKQTAGYFLRISQESSNSDLELLIGHGKSKLWLKSNLKMFYYQGSGRIIFTKKKSNHGAVHRNILGHKY